MNPEAWFIAIAVVALTLPLVLVTHMKRKQLLVLAAVLLIFTACAYWLLLKNRGCSPSGGPDVRDALPGDCYTTLF